MNRSARHKVRLRIMPLFLIAVVLGTAGLDELNETGSNWWPSAHAEESGHSGGHTGGSSGGRGGHSGDHESGHTDQGHDHDDGASQGGPRSGSGKHRGNASGGGGSKAVEDKIFTDGGSRPVWAGGGIPEVELGRLNVARAPKHVLRRALAEAEQAQASGEDIHSPLQNLALYEQVLTDASKFNLEQAAHYLGAASDKQIPITEDTVSALNIILGIQVDLSGYQYNGDSGIGAFAANANDVRTAIAEAHDEGESAH